MATKPTYEQLEQKVRQLEKDIRAYERGKAHSKKQQEQYRAWIENLPIGLYRNTPGAQGRFVIANPASARIHGCSSVEEFLETRVADLYTNPEERRAFSDKLLSQGKVAAEELRLKKKDGTTFWGAITATLVRDPSGKIEYFDGFIEDITERKRMEEELRIHQNRLEDLVRERTTELKSSIEQLQREITERKRAEEALRESEKKYSTLVESSLIGIYIDQDQRIVFANQTLADIYRYPREELTGLESRRLVHAEDRPLTDKIRAERLRGKKGPSEYEARGLTRDGDTIWIKRRNTTIEYGGRTAILGNVVDITERKRAEEELRRTNEELKNIVYVVSHDLKNPIITIQGFSARLLKSLQEKSQGRAGRYLEQIRTSAHRMEVLVTDLLELSKSGRVVSRFKDVPSLEMVSIVTSGLQDRLKENRIELVVADHLPSVHCDRDKICQVFENLIVNAIKFTGETKDPRIEIGYEDRGEAHQFYVRDNGIGIEPQYHRKIFEMFNRLKEMEDEKGTGLGLAIVERIVKNHAGKVWVESEKGKGATFYFALPKESDS